MKAILNEPCPFWEGKRVRDTHLLVLIPAEVNSQPFSLNLLGKLIQEPQGGGYKTRYRWYGEGVQQQIGAASPEASYWLLMTRDILPGSLSKSYEDQKEIVAGHANRIGLSYRLPKALEAATVILMHHVHSGERLYPDTLMSIYTRCEERLLHGTDKCFTVVGCFGPLGLIVYNFIYEFYRSGVSCCRKL